MTTIFPRNEEVTTGMPWQVKAIGFIGVPSVLAIYFGWALVADIRINQQTIKENLVLHAEQTETIKRQNERIITSLDLLKKVMDRICSNTARNYLERSACFQ